MCIPCYNEYYHVLDFLLRPIMYNYDDMASSGPQAPEFPNGVQPLLTPDQSPSQHRYAMNGVQPLLTPDQGPSQKSYAMNGVQPLNGVQQLQFNGGTSTPNPEIPPTNFPRPVLASQKDDALE